MSESSASDFVYLGAWKPQQERPQQKPEPYTFRSPNAAGAYFCMEDFFDVVRARLAKHLPGVTYELDVQPPMDGCGIFELRIQRESQENARAVLENQIPVSPLSCKQYVDLKMQSLFPDALYRFEQTEFGPQLRVEHFHFAAAQIAFPALSVAKLSPEDHYAMLYPRVQEALKGWKFLLHCSPDGSVELAVQGQDGEAYERARALFSEKMRVVRRLLYEEYCDLASSGEQEADPECPATLLLESAA